MKFPIRTAVLLAGALLLAGAALWFAPLNQDEGWYLLSALRVRQGFLPYRDFAFTQGPLFPFVYQGALPLVDRFGLAGGRLFTLLLAAGTFCAVLLTVYRSRVKTSRESPLWIAAALLGFNTFQAQYTTTVKTYALAGLLLSLALYLWLELQRRPHALRAAGCAFLLAAATGVRLSLGLFFLPLGISLLLRRNQWGHRPWIAFGVCGLIGLGVIFGPFWIAAPEAVWFGLIEFHAGREVASPWLLRAGFLSRTLAAYLPAVACLVVLSFRRPTLRPGFLPLGLGILLVTLLHLAAPFPYDDYQAALYPALVIWIAATLPDAFPKLEPRLPTAFAAVCLVFALSSPQIQSWFSAGRDRIWWRAKPKPDLAVLRETAAHLRERSPEADVLLTPDTYLAVEAGMDVPRGLEMGPFSYFPDMPFDRAVRLNVLNTDRLIHLILNSNAPLAALSGYGFTIQSPAITETAPEAQRRIRRALRDAYDPVSRVHPFGQGNTTLEIHQRAP